MANSKDPNFGEQSINREPKFKKEIAKDLGMSLSTFQRKLKEADFFVPRGLIMPDMQDKIYVYFGYKEGSH